MLVITIFITFLYRSNENYEDAYFVHNKGIGIADGVSSWSAFNIRTDLFSTTLMQNAKNSFENKLKKLGLDVNPQVGDHNHDPENAKIDPKEIMKEAFEKTLYAGSATCCIGVLNNGKLDIANLGDSGFMVFEYEKCFLKEKSKPQQHTFNYPLQMVRLPDEEVHKKLISSGYGSLSKDLNKLVESDAIICSNCQHADTYSICMNNK